jgi:hypothetical protein
MNKHGNNFINLAGKRFGRLLVLSLNGKIREEAAWTCRCDCGSEIICAGYPLRRGNTKSCGCLSRDRIENLNKKHGLSGTIEYNCWIRMKRRCCNPKDRKFKDYGGRGILVCARWVNSFESFLKDIGKRPSSMHSLGRINNDGNYEPGNVRWELPIEQANNCRSNHKILYNGKNLTISQWGRIIGTSPDNIYSRIGNGWSEIESITIPFKKNENNKLRTRKH